MPITDQRRRPASMVGLLTSASLALAAGTAIATAVGPSSAATASPPGAKDVTAVLFEWRFDSIARECRDTLGPKGYGFVQVSPPQEHIQGGQWWTSYQPVSYNIAGRLGDRSSFASMVSTCHQAGVKVIVDAVVNHMSAGSGTGTGGTNYSKYNYPGFYQVQDFHSCRTSIQDYTNRYDVQECELVGLSDLNTSSDYVRGRIAGYLNDLLSLGVDGFRIDAAKHMAASDLSAIKSRLSNPNAYWVQEMIHGAGEAVQPDEYLGSGDVQEFRYARDLKRVFQNEKLAYLSNFGTGWGYLPSDKAGVFVDNHDTERGGDTLSYKNGAEYTLAGVFMLAWPYGAPHVHSGYEFSNHDAGPPNGGHVNSCYSDGWKCQHAWRQLANMVGFRNAAAGTGVTNWWTDGDDQIAFGRGNKAYVAINRTGGALTRTFQTSLPAGTYCDVQHADLTTAGGCTGTTYTVNGSGQFTASIGAMDAIALHVGGSGPQPTTPGSNSTTVYYSTNRNWPTYNIHYAPTGGSWTTVPGTPMTAACTGWVKLTIALGAATGLTAAFNNGSGTWDNNGGGNYTLSGATVAIKDGTVSSTDPCATPPTPTTSNPPSGTGVSFGVNATTTLGQNIHVAGDHPALGSWDPATAPLLSSASYPVWRLTVALPAGTSISYKYIRKDANGNVTWESGANRTATVGNSGNVPLNDTWRN